MASTVKAAAMVEADVPPAKSAPASSAAPVSSERPVRGLYSENCVEFAAQLKGDCGAPSEDLDGLSDAVFNKKWENALNYIREKLDSINETELSSQEAERAEPVAATPEQSKEAERKERAYVSEILLEGAQCFGLWRISEAALQSLVNQVLGAGSDELSIGLSSWIRQGKEDERRPSGRKKSKDMQSTQILSLCGHELSDPDIEDPPKFRGLGSKDTTASAAPGGGLAHFHGVVDAMTLRRFKWGLAILLSLVSMIYGSWVAFVKYEGILEFFSWPIIFARAGAMGTAILTGLLYLSMARTFMKQFYKCLGRVHSKILMVLDGHKDVHIFQAKCLMVAAVVHVLGHLLSTVPALGYTAHGDLNGVIACANPDGKLRGWPTFSWLQWPQCPLTEDTQGWPVLWRSTVGLTGVLLCVLLALMGWTGRARYRARHFDVFWHVHNVILVLWPITMFIHGSNQWIGVGFPLVAFTASVPICLYLQDRVGRLLKYYIFGGKAVRISDVIIRPGANGGPNGALTNLQVEKPPGLWMYEPGMYAFICMPEYAPLQWHPFTICSGKNDEHVEFIIAGVGDWTRELASRCLRAQVGEGRLPRVALDGPYAAPTQSALSRPILVAVGAGVGITPFLSLMSSLISLLEDHNESQSLPLKEAHFFWMTRSADEFLFGRKHFTRIASSEHLRHKVHLHLHNTAKEPDGNGAAFLFRRAVKLQSKVDREAFKNEFDERKMLTAPQLPWCWVNKSQLDVMWLSDLTTDGLDGEKTEQTTLAASEGGLVASEGEAREPAATGSLQPAMVDRSRTWPAGGSHTGGGSQDVILEEPQASPSPYCNQSLLRRSHTQSWADNLLRVRSRLRATLAAQGEDYGGAPTQSQQTADLRPPGSTPLVPVAFGRPDFETELRAIGQHWGCTDKVHIYVCGNDTIVKGLRRTADVLNAEARANAQKSHASAKKYIVTYERFG